VKIQRLHGPSLPFTAWLAYLAMHVSHVSIVRERDLRALEVEMEMLETRAAGLEKSREFWHAEYTQVAEAFSKCVEAMGTTSNHGSSSQKPLEGFPESSRPPNAEA
jgi:hypothetical protein